MTLSGGAIDEIRGAYAMRFDSMLDALMQVVQRYPHGTVDPAERRRRLHGLLRGIITATLNSSSDVVSGVQVELGEVLHSLCDGSPEALLDIQDTLFVELTNDLLDAHPSLRPTVQRMLLHVVFGWIARSIGQPLAPDPAISYAATDTDDIYRQMVLQSPRPMFLIDVHGAGVLEYGPGMEQLFGYTLEEERNLPPEALVTEETPEDDYDLLIELLAGRIPHLERHMVRPHRDGTPVSFGMLGWPIRNDAGEITHLGQMLTPTPLREVTPAHRTMSDARIHYLAQLSSDPIFVVTAQRTIQYASPSVERSLGLMPGDVLGMALDDLVAEADQPRIVDVVAEVLTSPRKRATVELRLLRSNGEFPWFEVVAANLTDVDEVQGIALQGRDISYRKDLEERLAHLAMVDPLTQTLNRRGFLAALEEELAQQRPDQPLRVAYVDLDDFKGINDAYGHITGDALLMRIAEQLQTALGNDGCVGRIGGDEFVMFFRPPETGTLDSLESRLRSSLEESQEVEGHRVQASGSMGVVEHFADPETTSLDLLHQADRALYECKRKRTASIDRFDQTDRVEPQA